MTDEYIIRSAKPFYDIPDISVPELLSQLLEKLDKRLICCIDANTESKLTVEELLTKSKSIALALIERGITKTDIIMTYSENTVELVTFLFGAMFTGVTVYPISPSVNTYEVDQCINTLGQIVVFTSKLKSEIIGKIVANNSKPNVKFVGILDGIYDSFITLKDLIKEGQNKTLDRIPYFSVKPKEDLVFLMQSSGTSGVPKSVMISQRSFVANLMTMIRSDFKPEPTPKEQPVFGHMTPVSCMSGIITLIGYIALGVCVVTYRDYNPELILKSIEKYKVAMSFFVPTFGHTLLYGDLANKYDFSSVKLMITTGAAVPEHVCKGIIKKYNVFLQEVYGMTECCGLTLFPDMETPEFISGNLGPPAHNTEIKVIDVNTGKSLGPNLDGEICARSPKNFSGYLNNPDATNEAIDKDGWFHTGDIGHYDQRNRVFITDRLKELIKFGTKQVSPTELEQFLLTHESVAEVAVVGVKHETETQWPRAYVKCAQNKTVTEEELKKYVSDSLSEFKQLRAGVIFVDNILRTTVGKVDRRYYKQLVANELIKS